MSRVVHFEFASAEPQREIEFFRSVFGWDIQGWGDNPYWLADTGEGDIGINGAFLPLQSPEQPRVVNTIGVGDLDATMARATAAGATVAMERQEVPGIGWTAYLVSPTGILFGLLEPLPGM